MERMRFQDKIGYWVNDTLHDFLFQRAIQAESYEGYDLVQNARRIHVQEEILEIKTKEANELKTLLARSQGISEAKDVILDRSHDNLLKERKRRKVGQKLSTLGIIAAFAGGVWVGSR